MKRLLTAAVLCTVLILGSVWSVKAVDNTAQAVALDVENDRLNEARETWDAAQTLLGALLLHSEIDQADRLFDRVLAAQQNGSLCGHTAERLARRVEHIPLALDVFYFRKKGGHKGCYLLGIFDPFTSALSL
mgnify:CR=1 FL=1